MVSGPLDGVRVIDLTSMVSGPLCTMVLADQGADVIKVETRHGDHARRVASRNGGFSASFLNNNRNKRSVVIDLKKPGGVGAFMHLVRDADVVVQNFRPGVADRIGVGEAACRGTNPKIIYASISGFGATGPYAQKPVFDPLIQATSGLTTVQSGSDQQRPRLVRTILPDKLTGIQASQAITAALFSRERTGKGQHIELSMLDTVIAFLWSSDMSGHTFVGRETDVERAQSFIDLIYETRDGFVSIATMQDKEWVGFARAVGRPDLLEDERFKTPALREINKDARLGLIQETVQEFETKDLLDRLEREDVPCAPVLTRGQMIQHPQVEANAILVETNHPQAGPLRQTRHAAKFDMTPTEIRMGAPMLGAHTREVLLEAGMSNEEIAKLEASGAIVQQTAGEEAA